MNNCNENSWWESSASAAALSLVLYGRIIFPTETSDVHASAEQKSLDQSIFNFAYLITLGRSPNVTRIVTVGWLWGSADRLNICRHHFSRYAFTFFSDCQAIEQTAGPFTMHDVSNDEVWFKKVPCGYHSTILRLEPQIPKTAIYNPHMSIFPPNQLPRITLKS
jgi:hypothetical protein